MTTRSPVKPDAPTARLRVGFVLARHFTLTAFANFIDTLRLAADEGDRSRQILCSWTIMSATGRPIVSSSGVAVVPGAGLVDPKQFHYIVVVGGLLHRGEQIDAEIAAYLRRAAALRTPLIGVCTGSFVLARLGLLEGRKTCVSWYHRHDFIDEFGVAPIADRLYVIDGDRITCSGGAGVVDLAAALVEKHVGVQAAKKSLHVLLLDEQRAADSAQPTPHVAPAAADARVRRAVLAMEQAMAEPLAIATLAEQLGVSERQLDRLFRRELGASPSEIYRGMRLDYGYWLVANSRRSIGEAAALAGFSDGAHFARAFRRRFGVNPAALRQTNAAADTDGPVDRRLFRPSSESGKIPTT
ncbi:GlxA family transcriptional regulator [Pinisolibacter sp.]|uniref:GlxA family transcriptional regulator n=1 Tax=Pinisolibacter sp. TaxID=2172024 RepID=UPI002FDE5AA7